MRCSYMQHSYLFQCAYFSLGKEADCAHSEPISEICRRSIMENMLADGLVIFLNVPKYYNITKQKQ